MFDINQCYDTFYTEPDTAYFWSGLGKNGQNIAAEVASKKEGVTLEMLMNAHKDDLIKAGFEYDEELDRFLFSSDNYSDWEAISLAFASQASGTVHVVLGENVRSDGVWNTKELPALSENSNVTKIIAVDSHTGQDKSVLLDKTSGSTNESGHVSSPFVSSKNIESVSGGGSQAPPVTAVETVQNSTNNKEPKGKVDTNTTDGFYDAKLPSSNNPSSPNQGIGKSNNGFNM